MSGQGCSEYYEVWKDGEITLVLIDRDSNMTNKQLNIDAKWSEEVREFEKALERCGYALTMLEKEQESAVAAWFNLPETLREIFADRVMALLPIQGASDDPQPTL